LIEKMIDLPEIFLNRMKDLMDAEEFSAFTKSYEEPPLRGLRLNLLKPTKIDDLDKGFFTPVPWCNEGFIFPSDMRPAKSIAYHAGLFYIQEPSAMCPAEVLKPQPGEKVLDICAAPGGKSVQLAGHMRGRGTLISNDASASRSRALVKNLERAGVTNAIVTTELPKKLAERFANFFDCILVDAPCSGEGMFRRDGDLIKAYSANKPEACVLMQREILFFAAKMLKPGGRLVYSTCTFNPMENEDVIAGFLAGQNDFELKKTNRIWPHLAPGEGHFVALLEKSAGKHSAGTCGSAGVISANAFSQEFSEFCREFLQDDFVGAMFPRKRLILHGTSLYLQPERLDLRGLRVARSGWLLGESAKGRFVPSQALAMGLRKEQAKFTADLSEEDATRYLRGDSLELPSESVISHKSNKPWVLICHESFPLGWARLVQGRLKNNLPTGWVRS